MSTPCPAPEELLRLLDGELTENRAGALRSHAAGCRACGGELRLQERLVARIAAPMPGLDGGATVAAAMGRLDAAPPAPALPARWRPGPRTWAGLAAAAALLLVVNLPHRRADVFTARGAPVAWSQKVGVELWALEGQPRRLGPGDELPRGVPVVASYSNIDPGAAYLLAYAIDGRGEVHWLYPAFTSPGGDPEALRLDGAVVQRALPDSAVFEDVPAGALRFVTVVTRQPHRLSEIEAARPEDRTPEAVRRRWPDARVDELTVRAAAVPPAAPGGRP
jgi:hypothetical protein